MKEYRLCVILDKELVKNNNLVDTAKEIIDGGAVLIQYRDKISPLKEVIKIAEDLVNLNCKLIINDYPDVVKNTDAFGVHLGKDDMNTMDARNLLGAEKIIGRSATSIEQSIKAEKEGADYIGFGPIFSTSTKKDTVKPLGVNNLKKISNNIKIPVFAIGGINLYNLDSILSCGIHNIAVANSIICSNDIGFTVKEFLKRLEI